MIMIMIHPVITVQYRLVMLKTMEDGGITVADILTSIVNTILQSLAPCTLLALGIIPGGSR